MGQDTTGHSVPGHDPDTLRATVRVLVLTQHLLFAVLFVSCTARALTSAPPGPVLGAAVLLAGWYLAGLPRQRRAARERPLPQHPALQHPARPQPAPPQPAAPQQPAPTDRSTRSGGWLAGLVACWLLAVVVSPDNVWLAVPLWLLAGHLVPLGWGVSLTVALLAVVVLRPLLTPEGVLLMPTTGEVIGPSVGAAFAFLAARGQLRLVREVQARQALVSTLLTAQAETEVLQVELAEAHRESGAQQERTRLSREVHDTLAQGFSSIVLTARSALRHDDPQQATDALRAIEATAADNLAEARRVVAALAPAALDGGGLAAALRRLTDSLSQGAGPITELRIDGPLPPLPADVEVALLRTAQSALANVRAHAHASRVVVTLTMLDGPPEDSPDEPCVRLDVVDDGLGFDPAQWERLDLAPTDAGGYGLRAMRARLTELGGGLDLESAPGEGTALSAYLPLSYLPVSSVTPHRTAASAGEGPR